LSLKPLKFVSTLIRRFLVIWVSAALQILGGLLSAQDDRGITPLMVAASYGSLGSVRQLVTLGASVSLQDERGYSAFHFAAEKVKQQCIIR
jgi:ankyrin repeat protein